MKTLRHLADKMIRSVGGSQVGEWRLLRVCPTYADAKREQTRCAGHNFETRVRSRSFYYHGASVPEFVVEWRWTR